MIKKSSCFDFIKSYFTMCHILVLSVLLIFAFPCHVARGNSEFIQKDIVNLEVSSKIELKDQFARIKNKIVFVNKGSAVVTSYEYVENEPELYHITFYDQKGSELDFKRIISEASNLSCYEINLNANVSENEQYTVISTIVYANKIVPAFKQRRMEEDQVMKFKGYARFFSMYNTEFTKIQYLLINASLLEVTKNPTHSTNDKVIFEFHNTEKYNADPIELIFVNNDAFLVVKSLFRTLCISHFGKISVQDEVVIENNGPKFVGPYMSTAMGKQKAATGWLYTHLPASAENIEFFDILGNSSKTIIYRYHDYLTLKFKTRYPLLGGWKTSYTLRYDVPIHEYLFKSENYYSLQIRSIDYVIDGKVIESAVIKIILPEGASLKKFIIPNMLTFRSEEIGCPVGFCVFGRKIITFNGTNLFENYIVTSTVDYFMNPLYLLLIPLTISVYLESIFLFILCGNKILL